VESAIALHTKLRVLEDARMEALTQLSLTEITPTQMVMMQLMLAAIADS